ncbi:MAG: hypothetical protein ACOYMW_02505 [Candidatus Competibacteraceae bacterium]
MMQFPANWPEKCPPADAEDADGKVYRLVRSDPPTINDFRSHAELGKMLKAPPCLRHGLSTFRRYEDAHHQRDLLPMLGDRIAAAELKPEHGKTKLTSGKQPTHTTWWPGEHVDRASLFRGVLAPTDPK